MQKLYITVAVCALTCWAMTAIAQASNGDSDLASTIQQTRNALGASSLQSRGTLQIKETVTSNGLSGTGTSAGSIGGILFAERFSTPPVVSADGYDGTSMWNQDQTGLVWVDDSVGGRSQEIDQAYAFNQTLFTPGAGGALVSWSGARSDGGHRYTVVIVTPKGSHLPMQVWIDMASHLPSRYVIALGPIVNTVTVSDYRSVDGYMVAYRRTQSSAGNSTDAAVSSAKIVDSGNTGLSRPASSVHDFSMNAGRSSTTVPFELINNHVHLEVMLNGKGPYRFVFDTGGVNVIDPTVASEIGAKGAGAAQMGGVGAATQSISIGTVDSLQIGDALLRNQVFAVAPVRQLLGVTGEKTDGVIGFEVLARYVTTFDYAGHTITLQMPGASPPAGATVMSFYFGGTQPQFKCTIDGIASDCAVDTGSHATLDLFSPWVAAHPQVLPSGHSAESVNGFGVGGGSKGLLGRLESLGFSQFMLHDLIAGYSTDKGGGFALPFVAANVGGGVWKRFTVTFDYANETMALQPNTSFAARDVYERAGLFLISNGGKIIVFDVRPGTPAAEAGIVKGDVIVGFDGKAPTLSQVRKAIDGPVGTVLRLQVASKDGTTKTIAVTLRDWV